MSEVVVALVPRSLIPVSSMLEDQSVNAYIRWNETGDSIVIPDIEEFKMNALRKYFDVPVGATVLSSEVRQSHFGG